MAIDRVKYNDFIKSVEILNFIFPEVSWKLHNFPPKRNKINNKITFGLKRPLISKNRDRIVIRGEMSIVGKAGAKEKEIFEISLIQDLVIGVNPELLTEELLKIYIERNAIFTIIANFREKIKIISFEMGLPPLILPALKVIPKDESKKDKKEKIFEKNSSK